MLSDRIRRAWEGRISGCQLGEQVDGATVGGLWGIQGDAIPARWTAPWRGRVASSLAGHDEVTLDSLVERTARVAAALADAAPERDRDSVSAG